MIRKLNSGKRTWEIQVAADGNELDDLRIAKEKALQLDQEFSEEFEPMEEPEELPY